MSALYQQINLYQPVFRQQRKVFSAATLAQIIGAVLALLLLLLGHAHWTLAGMKSDAQALQARHDHLRNTITALEEQLKTPDTAGLVSEIEDLHGQLDRRTQLLERFSELSLTRSAGFASAFTILAEQQVRGLWLDGVTVADDGTIEIRGTTLDASLVPLYMQKLEAEPSLSDSAFETVSLTRPDPEKPHLQFVLRNRAGD